MKVTIEVDGALLEACRMTKPSFNLNDVFPFLERLSDAVQAADRENAKGGHVVYEYDRDGRRWNLPSDLRSAPSVLHLDGASYCCGKAEVLGRHEIVFELPLDYEGEKTRPVYLLSIGGDGKVRWSVYREPRGSTEEKERDREAIRTFRLR